MQGPRVIVALLWLPLRQPNTGESFRFSNPFRKEKLCSPCHGNRRMSHLETTCSSGQDGTSRNRARIHSSLEGHAGVLLSVHQGAQHDGRYDFVGE